MASRTLRLWAALIALWPPAALQAAAPPYLDPDAEFWPDDVRGPAAEPFKAAVVGGRMLFHSQNGGHVLTQAIPLRGPARLRSVLHNVPYPGQTRWPPAGVTLTAQVDDFPLRWHVTRKACYFGQAADIVSTIGVEHLRRFDLRELVKGTADSDAHHSARPPFQQYTRSSPGNDARNYGFFCLFDCRVYYDYLPDRDRGARQFVLANTRRPAQPTGPEDESWIKKREEQKTVPKWSFTVHHCKTEWDEKGRKWIPGAWSKEEDLPVVFREHFHALGKGDDWYFLTASGRLFVARKPAKGKKRSLESVYDDALRPILGMVVDAQSQRTFLFADSDRGPAFFELSDDPVIIPYQPDVAEMPEGDEPLRSIMHKARVLAALGKIKGK